MKHNTIITALYDINRESLGDGRSISQYLEWFDKTLELNCPMVIYTESKFVDFVEKRRRPHNTRIIEQKLEEIPYYRYVNKIDEILHYNIKYQNNICDRSRIECRLALYNVIQYSKFCWLQQAARSNYFHSSNFFWMDAGCSRFFDDIDPYQPWPQNQDLIQDDHLLIQGNCNTERYLKNWPGDDRYIYDNNCILVGTLFGGNKEIIDKVSEYVEGTFLYFCDRGIVNNEQIILGILLQNNPILFNVYIEVNGKHLPLFRALGTP